MRVLLLLAAPSLAAVLAGCATPPSEAAGLRPELAVDADRPGALYALYLGGQSALLSGRSAEAAAYFNQAVAEAPGDSRVRERAFISALLAGEVERAAELAVTDGEGSPANQRLGKLVLAVDRLAAGKAKLAAAELSGDGVGYPHRTAAGLLKPWALAAAGDLQGALQPADPGRDRVLELFGRRTRALLLERAKRFEEAETEWKALNAAAPGNNLFVLDYGEFLERRGRRAEAASLYRADLAGGADAEMTRALARATARRGAAPKPPTPAEGAAAALLAPAASLIAERQEELGLAYLRLALRLDPKLDDAWLMVGDSLSEQKDFEGARAAYAEIRPGSDNYAAAQSRSAWTYQQAGDTAQALRLAQTAARAAPGDRALQLAYADLLRAAERYEESAAVLTRLIDAAGSAKPDWRLLYARGIALKRAGRWAEAERDMVKAVEFNPDHAALLNHLAYAWVDRGVRLEQAFPMLEKAVSLEPRNGAVIDSLGWAHYRLGRLGKALEQLERAVELEPADPEINSHLGDVYWRLGRRNEAQFQWRRVLTLEPEAELRTEVEAKLRSGLGPQGPAPAATQAAAP